MATVSSMSFNISCSSAPTYRALAVPRMHLLHKSSAMACSHGHVKQITLRSGSVPTELGLLPALEMLTLVGPSLTGTLPTQLGRLSALQRLAAVRSSLSGTLPERLGGVCAGEPRDGAGPPLLAVHKYPAWASTRTSR